MSKPTNPICVAIDTRDHGIACSLVESLKTHVGIFKVGLEYFCANGPTGVGALQSYGKGAEFFLDLKLLDIPNTVAKTIRVLNYLAVDYLTVHASGSLDMLRAAKEAANRDMKLLGVTVLTSEDCATDRTVELAVRAAAAGLAGVVCSASAAPVVRRVIGPDMLIVIPGIRPADAETHDQRRVATPREARTAGADILVIGRPITKADDPVAAVQAIWRDAFPVFPGGRRNRIDQMTPAECAIRYAMTAVEGAGADPLLTDAVTLLAQAQAKVADYVDGKGNGN